MRRGYDPDDARRFGAAALGQLKAASQEMQWLLDRGYKTGPVIDLVGGHHQLTTRQRTALRRAVSSSQQLAGRQATRLPLAAASQGCLYIDGFNLIITLEVALSGSLLILGNDGVIRDLAGLRGTYRLISQTSQALQLIGKILAQLAVPAAVFYLDAPVANSGKLRSKILACSAGWGMPVQVELVPDADRCLALQEGIVTSDSVLLDSCRSWYNLAAGIIAASIPEAWIVSMNGGSLPGDTGDASCQQSLVV